MLAAALILALAAPARAVIPVTDPGVVTVIQVQTQANSLYQQFMRLQVVQDAITLKNNYLVAKQYYDTVEEHSQHRGGLMGYYRDYFDQQFQNLAQDEWRRMNTEASSITGDTAVGRLVAAGAAAVAQQTGNAINGAGGMIGSGMNAVDGGYQGARGLIFTEKKAQVAAVDKLIATSEDRADATQKMVADLVTRGSSSVISDSERESIDMHAQLLHLQLLSEIRQLLNVNAQIANSRAKQDLEEISIALKASADLATRRAAGPKAAALPQSDQIVHEMQRRPGEQ